jgi:hypothetical protein
MKAMMSATSAGSKNWPGAHGIIATCCLLQPASYLRNRVISSPPASFSVTLVGDSETKRAVAEVVAEVKPGAGDAGASGLAFAILMWMAVWYRALQE